MKKSHKIYSISQLVSAVIMILALLWLTVSTPFVYAAQQEMAKQQKTEKAASPLAGNEEESSNPFGSTEEKASGNISLSEEYIHNNYRIHFFFSIATQYHNCENADTYIAFHGELLVPPPDFS